MSLCGLGLVLLGGVVLFGRFAGWPLLVTVLPDGAPMAFPTAVAFALAGACFLAHAAERLLAARVLAALTTGAGLGVLGIYFVAEPMGLYQWGHDPASFARGVGFDGRMSPNTASSFALTGLALWELAAPRPRFRLIQVMASFVLAVAFLALYGHVTGLRVTYSWWRYTGMAVHTAAGFFAAALTLLGAAGRRATPEERAAARSMPFFAIAGSIVLVVGITAFVSNAQQNESTAAVTRSYEVIASVNYAELCVTRMESASRGFALSREEGLAAFYRDIDGRLRAELLNLRFLVEEDRAQAAGVHRLAGLLAAKRNFMQMTLARDEARPDRPWGAGATLMQDVREAVNRIEHHERSKLRRQLAETDRLAEQTNRIILFGNAAALAFFIAALFAVRRAERARAEAEAGLRRNEAVLRESEERFRGLAQHAPVGIYLTDPAGACTYVNDRWCGITGLAAPEALGAGWMRVLHPEDAPNVAAWWREFTEAGGVFARDYRFLRPDGAVAWVTGHAVHLRDKGGRVSGCIGTVMDITDRKQLEAGHAQMRDQALEASRLKSEFLANMSHEVRTPMNGVIGMAALLADTPLTADQREMTQVIRGGAESLLAVVNDILDFSRVEAGRMRIEESGFDLHEVVDETLALLLPRAQAKGLALDCEVDPDLPAALRGDAGRIRQVLTNLTGNAVKFTEAGRVTVAVRRTSLTATHAGFRTEVRDTGIGIPRDQHGRLFRPFTQADGTSTRRYGGTGLGLAISRQLVELMGGRIGFESEPGRGSVFWFELTLPLATAPGSARPGERGPAAHSGVRLLVAEDNPANQQVTRRMVERLGHECVIVNDGAAALAALAGGGFHAVLMDCQMPGMDGYTATRRIRAGAVPGVNARLPIIAVTAHAMEGDRERCLQAGMSDYVTKPVLPGVLAQALRRCGIEG